MSILLHVGSNGCDFCDHVDFSTQGSSYFIIFYVHTVFVSVVILYGVWPLEWCSTFVNTILCQINHQLQNCDQDYTQVALLFRLGQVKHEMGWYNELIPNLAGLFQPMTGTSADYNRHIEAVFCLWSAHVSQKWTCCSGLWHNGW